MIEYMIDVCSECGEQVDLDQTACPQDCFRHPGALVIAVKIEMSEREARELAQRTLREEY